MHCTLTCYIIIKIFFFQQTSQSVVDQNNSDITRLHREGTCPFFSTSQRSKLLSADEEVLKLEDGTQIPIDEAVNIFESISFDDISNGKQLLF